MKTLAIIAAVLSLFAAAGAVFLHARTYVEPWLPVAIAAALAASIAILTSRRRPLRALLVFLAVTAVADFTLLTLNYTLAPDHTDTPVTATIVARNVRTSHPTRRIGRGRYVRDTSRKTYHYEYTLRLPDGHTVTRATNPEGYRRLRIGRHETVHLRRGPLGWTVIR
ncbi:MAG: hypothetical protein K2L76_08165 [Muribaculaceae bacterium]|nr:hypothetical protein [Muribaculaceae bacterium]